MGVLKKGGQLPISTYRFPDISGEGEKFMNNLAEAGFFEQKNGIEFESFAAMVHREKGQEDFEKEDDLDDRYDRT